jgi:DNA-binding transcriptional MerR regulator
MSATAPHREDACTIGALAAAFGLTLRAIRFYEDEGLISPMRQGTVRLYGHRDRARLQLVCRGKRLGFSLSEIKEFLDLYDRDPTQVSQALYVRDHARQRIAALETQLRDVEQTLADLRAIEAEMTAHLAGNAAAEGA